MIQTECKEKRVSDLKYLGSTEQSNRECGTEVKKRVQTELHGR